MHHSNNKDEFRFDCVQDSVREDMRKAATNVVIENSPTFWRF